MDQQTPVELEGPKRLKARFLAVVRWPGIKVEQARVRFIKIPFLGFIYNVLESMGFDGASEVVGSIAYYSIFSLFPLLLGVISLLGFFLPSAEVQEQIFGFIETNLPVAEDLIRLNITAIIQARGALGIVSLFALFWSASAMFYAINRGVNRAWGLNIRHPFHIRKLRELAMSLGASVFFYLVITATAVFSSFSPGGETAGGVAMNFMGFLLIFLVFLLSYKTIPNTKTYWRYVWPGALFSATAFTLARLFMVFYFSRFSRLDLVYGSVSSIIILLMFTYYMAFILIMGAEICSEYTRMRLGLPPRPRFPADLCPV